MSARDTYNKAKEEKNLATREKLKSLASKLCKVLYIRMNIKEQKRELSKEDIYENVRKDINRRQTVHSNKSANYRSGTPEMPDRRKKCIAVMTTTTTTTTTRPGCQLTTIIFI